LDLFGGRGQVVGFCYVADPRLDGRALSNECLASLLEFLIGDVKQQQMAPRG
jgi:hypothetical protein